MFFDENKEFLKKLISPITLAEIGEAMGKSAQTVSNSFVEDENEKKIPVSLETKERISDAIIALAEEKANLLKRLKKEKRKGVVLS